MKYYLAGPMTGIDKFNFPAFEKAAKKLRAQGLEIVSPHEIDHGETEETRGSKDYWIYVKADLKAMLECDAIILLDGWRQSRGCQFEVKLARQTNMEMFLYHDGNLMGVR
jgi:nucleoside 2-deoxyribosyltransferase